MTAFLVCDAIIEALALVALVVVWRVADLALVLGRTYHAITSAKKKIRVDPRIQRLAGLDSVSKP